MTLAIAAEFPWGKWREIMATAPWRFPSSIILAADTRWTREGRKPIESGRKLFTLGRQIGIVLAGDVWAGEEAVNRLRKAGKDAKFTGVNDVLELARNVFRETYSAHRQAALAGERTACYPLWFLVGFIDRQSYTCLARLSSEADFHPIILSGVQAIGAPSAIEKARIDLIARVGDPATNPNLSEDPLPWAMQVAGVIHEIIEGGQEPTVGGRVQMVVGTRDGWTEHEMSVLADGADPEAEADWNQATHPLRTLTTARRAGYRPLASCGDAALDIVQVS